MHCVTETAAIKAEMDREVNYYLTKINSHTLRELPEILCNHRGPSGTSFNTHPVLLCNYVIWLPEVHIS